MSKDWLAKRENQRKREIEKFTEGWNWESVFLTWSHRIGQFPVSFEPLFTEVWIHDPDNPLGRNNSLSWWPVKSVQKLQVAFQRHLDRFPGTNGPVHPYNYRQGELDTLRYIWENKGDKEKVAAILINASLFSRLYSSRLQYPKDYWPPYYCVEELNKLAYIKWNEEKNFSAWQHYHTEVLPYSNADDDYNFNNMNSLVRYLADEHALLFLNYKPVSIEFRAEREPFIDKILKNISPENK